MDSNPRHARSDSASSLGSTRTRVSARKGRLLLIRSFTFTLIGIAAVTTASAAQTCSGLYETANAVLAAYNDYNVSVSGVGATKSSESNMAARSVSFFNYAKSYFQAADGTDTDSDALISQCDNSTRIVVYKAFAEIVVFGARARAIDGKTWLDHGAFFLHRLMLVLQKSNQSDGDLPELTEHLKAAYARAHLSIPPDLIEVDGYVSR